MVLNKNTDETHEDMEQGNSNELSPKLLKPRTSENQRPRTSSAVLTYEQQPQRKRAIIRLVVFVVCLAFLFIGRAGVPSNEPACVVDKLMNLFDGLNTYIMNNPALRNTLQIICSLFMDVMFFVTGGYWILRGNSSRVIISVLGFYIVRAIIQAIWFSPFPATGTYWWFDPGFPSFVVPYGKGSDFFFSGHIGFVTICALEWRKHGNNLMFWILTAGGVYTALILLIYHVHYSIDLFVGVFFAHYVFMMVDFYKEPIDAFLIRTFYKMKYLARRVAGMITGKDYSQEYL